MGRDQDEVIEAKQDNMILTIDQNSFLEIPGSANAKRYRTEQQSIFSV